MEETLQEAYTRGAENGRRDTRLDHHAEQIKATTTAISKLVEVAQTMSATMQTLTEARVTDAATRLATAEAVKESKDSAEAQVKAENTKIDKFWTPRTRLFGFVVGIATVAYYVFASTH